MNPDHYYIEKGEGRDLWAMYTARLRESHALSHLTDMDVCSYVSERLAPCEVKRVEDHIDHCAQCRAQVDALKDMEQLVPIELSEAQHGQNNDFIQKTLAAHKCEKSIGTDRRDEKSHGESTKIRSIPFAVSRKGWQVAAVFLIFLALPLMAMVGWNL